MIIEPLADRHLKDVLVIEADLFGREAWTIGMLKEELAAGYHYVAATEDAELLGYAGIAVGEDEAWVNNIAVRRASQGRGIGRVLLEDLLAAAGKLTVGLEVAADNPAQHLYAKYGFEIVAVRKRYYQPSNTDALVMLREAQ